MVFDQNACSGRQLLALIFNTATTRLGDPLLLWNREADWRGASDCVSVVAGVIDALVSGHRSWHHHQSRTAGGETEWIGLRPRGREQSRLWI